MTSYALAANRHMAQFGTTPEQLAQIAVDTRRWAAMNPRARYQDPITSTTCSRHRVASPLHQLDCCLRHRRRRRVRGDLGRTRTRTSRTTGVRARRRDRPRPLDHLADARPHRDTRRDLGAGGVRPRRASRPTTSTCCRAYDSFTITALLHLEDLGFCAKGEGGAFVADGTLGPGGALPMNTNGGGLSYTHPGQYGMFLLVEAVRQLRGECGERQVAGAEVAVAHGCGGVLSATGTVVLGTEATLMTAPGRDRRSSDESRPFWDATREQRFVLPWCTGCDAAIWYPRLVCPAVSRRRDRVARRRRATARCTPPASTTKPGPGRDADDGPYVVVLVDLDAGVRMMSNVVGCPPDEVAAGMRVALAWEPLSDGRHLPVFRPA